MNKQAKPRRYDSFDELSLGQEVHLRGPDDDENAEPAYRDAKYLGGNSFYMPSLGRPEQVSPVNYRPWTRHRS